MSAKAFHALTTLLLGVAVGVVWLRVFWNRTREVPAIILATPVAAAILGLGHWVAYDFSLSHWASDFSLLQASFNILVASVLLLRRGVLEPGSA